MIPKFPYFKPLDIDDKDIYSKKMSEYPPYSDILFATLHIWWNLAGKLSISSLNENVIINYHLPFDDESSGFGLIGESCVDNSIGIIFKHLKDNKQDIKLVHTPEFVVKKIVNKKVLLIKEETDYAEYILECKPLSMLEGHEYYDLRYQVNRFLREVNDKKLEVKSLNLSLGKVQKEILNHIYEWEKKYPPKNDLLRTEHLALKQSLKYAGVLDLKSLAVYVDKMLCGIVIYHQPMDKEYYVLHHLKVNYEVPYISDFIYHHLAKISLDKGIEYLNIEMDLGVESLRIHKKRLNPIRMLRKYSIRPKV